MYDWELYDEIIQKIKDYFGETFDETLFLNGGCFWFADYCVQHMQNASILINKAQEHCAVEIQNQLYDITGRISSRHYVWATPQNIAYMKQHYIPTFHPKDLEDYLEREMKQFGYKEA